jgi:hypothetical protein
MDLNKRRPMHAASGTATWLIDGRKSPVTASLDPVNPHLVET